MTLAEIEFPWWLLLSPDLIATLAAVLLVFLVAAAIVGLLVYRRARTDPAWARLLLTLRSQYQEPGPWRDVDRLRLRVADALDGGRRALEVAGRGGPAAGEARALHGRMKRLAELLDGQLRLLGAEPDGRALRELLGPARARVEALERVARALRNAAALQMEGAMTGELTDLARDADRELSALRAGVEELEQMTARFERDPLPVRHARPGERA